jgi:hypothetical protein
MAAISPRSCKLPIPDQTRKMNITSKRVTTGANSRITAIINKNQKIENNTSHNKNNSTNNNITIINRKRKQ